jgi:hypothetical protein
VPIPHVLDSVVFRRALLFSMAQYGARMAQKFGAKSPRFACHSAPSIVRHSALAKTCCTTQSYRSAVGMVPWPASRIPRALFWFVVKVAARN